MFKILCILHKQILLLLLFIGTDKYYPLISVLLHTSLMRSAWSTTSVRPLSCSEESREGSWNTYTVTTSVAATGNTQVIAQQGNTLVIVQQATHGSQPNQVIARHSDQEIKHVLSPHLLLYWLHSTVFPQFQCFGRETL